MYSQNVFQMNTKKWRLIHRIVYFEQNSCWIEKLIMQIMRCTLSPVVILATKVQGSLLCSFPQFLSLYSSLPPIGREILSKSDGMLTTMSFISMLILFNNTVIEFLSKSFFTRGCTYESYALSLTGKVSLQSPVIQRLSN